MKKTELGRVHYLTTTLTFPHDRDQWVKQEPIAGASTMAILHFIDGLAIPDEQKTVLCKRLITSWKDERGVWIHLAIETTKRKTAWGNLKKRPTH